MKRISTSLVRVCGALPCIFLLCLFVSCHGQINNSAARDKAARDKTNTGSPAQSEPEMAEYMFLGMPEKIGSTDTSAAWKQPGQKLMITGYVYQQDGKTPAGDVIVYYYQTNTEGRYIHNPAEKRSAPPNSEGQTHGYVRGWIRTGSDGKYSIFTARPGAYPTRDEPAHIHLTIREPGKEKTYYIDDLVFDDDKLLTSSKRKNMENRGGSGVLRVLHKDSLQIAEHNIILGLNIPGYQTNNISKIQSGLPIGVDQPSFTPFHAYGPDKGSRACPVCKYGRYHGIMYFVGNNTDWTDIKNWLRFLEQESISRSKYLKAYFVYGSENNYSKSSRQRELEKIGNELNLKHVALTFVPSFSDTESDANLNKINPDVENTFIIYRHRAIIDKYIDLKPTQENFKTISTILDNTKGGYFDLAEPGHN
jgi:protocatechuate 3,4-dioxygenase beta subunit